MVNSISGSTILPFKQRLSGHQSDFKKSQQNLEQRKTCPILFAAFAKYGLESFKFEIIEKLKPEIEIVRQQEESYIKSLNPEYNICTEPTRGGSPNKGRKLSQEWKDNIGKKSSEYKHSPEVRAKLGLNNKLNACSIRIWKDDFEFIGSAVECDEIIGKGSGYIQFLLSKAKRAEWKAERLKPQGIKVKISNDEESYIFNSLSACDKYFNMWRGYTSTTILNKRLILDKYNYEFV